MSPAFTGEFPALSWGLWMMRHLHEHDENGENEEEHSGRPGSWAHVGFRANAGNSPQNEGLKGHE